MEPVRSWLKKGCAVFLDVLFPPQCVACRTALTSRDLHPCLCSNCFDSIEIFSYFTCPQCGRRLPVLKNTCHPETKFILAAAAPYQNAAVRELVQSLKYAGVRNAAQTIASLLARYLGTLPDLDTREYAAVPIPLHKRREWERGFNQAALIAEALTKHERFKNVPVASDTLRRTRNTHPQASRGSAAARAQNVAGCFTLSDPARVRGKTIFLVDDVFTSGATMGEAAKVLRAGGAERIIGIVVAKA